MTGRSVVHIAHLRIRCPQQAGELLEDAREKMGSLRGQAEEMVEEARQKAGELLHEARDKAGELGQQAGELLDKARGRGDDGSLR